MQATDCDLLRLELEQSPSDQTLRLAWADALRERGDPLADGVEALARNGKWAFNNTRPSGETNFLWASTSAEVVHPEGPYPLVIPAPDHCKLTLDWLTEAAPLNALLFWIGWGCCSYAEADLFAAAGFLKLPPARQRELLGR